MPRSTTVEDYVLKLKKSQPHIKLVGSFSKMHTPTKHKCKKCNHIWKPVPMSLTRTSAGTGICPSCNSTFVDLTGKKFGRVRVTKVTTERNSRNELYWKCKCDCGTLFKTAGRNLKAGDTTSCGCKKLEVATKHGLYKTNEYHILQDMIIRCKPSKEGGDPNYGDRGITVCDRWKNGSGKLTGIECFIKDMGSRPSKDHSIDRKNNNKGYSPKNCRWVDWKTQCRNKRTNKIISFEGKRMTVVEAIEKSRTHINSGLVYYRIEKKGWSAEKAIYTSVNSSM